MRAGKLAGLLASVALCLSVGRLGSLATETSRTTWYAALQKPPLNPPDWVFAPVWTALYLLMAVAGWRVWAFGGQGKGRWLRLFALQLALNGIWSYLFFGLRNPFLALIDILALGACLIVLTAGSRKLDRISAYLLLPLLSWVGFAAYLNASLWWLNR